MKTTLLGLAVAGFAIPAVAETLRQHGAHEHGAARLMVSAEGGELVVALDSPAFNLFGFEHQPSTEAQKDAVTQAVAALERGGDLFAFSKAAGCAFEESQLESRVLAEGDGPAADGEKAGDHGHRDEHHHDEGHHAEDHHDEGHHDEGHHDEGHHDEGRHDEGHHDEGHHDEGHHAEGHHDEGYHDEHHHDEHHHEGEPSGGSSQTGHSDVMVEWHFECKDLSRLTEIEVKLFELFPNLDDLDAQYITDVGQGAAELSPLNTSLRF